MTFRSALVTGGSGFVGLELCRALAREGVRVTSLTRSPAAGPWQDQIQVDLGREAPPAGALAGIEAVFHLAGKVHDLSGVEADEAEYRRVNVEGTRVLLDAAVAAGVACFVYMSSVKAMGEGGERCLDESSPPVPETAYGRTKLEAERLVLEAGARAGMHAVVIRPCMVYGAGCKGNLPRMLRAVARGRFPPLAGVRNRRSLVHVRDLVAAALLCARSARAAGRVYLVTDGNTYSTREIYELAVRATGRKIPPWSVPMGLVSAVATGGDLLGRLCRRRLPLDRDSVRKLTESAWYSCDRITRDLGYRPRFNLDDGLREMVATGRSSGS